MNIQQAYKLVFQHAKKPHVCKHHVLAKQCGYFATAKYLKNRGYTIDQALAILGFKDRMRLDDCI